MNGPFDSTDMPVAQPSAQAQITDDHIGPIEEYRQTTMAPSREHDRGFDPETSRLDGHNAASFVDVSPFAPTDPGAEGTTDEFDAGDGVNCSRNTLDRE
jgi:hypothetical protein